MGEISHLPRQEALRLLKQLRHDASWNEIIYTFGVRAAIERGLADANAGRVTDIDSVRAEFGLDGLGRD